jgi:hypothetical protein
MKGRKIKKVSVFVLAAVVLFSSVLVGITVSKKVEASQTPGTYSINGSVDSYFEAETFQTQTGALLIQTTDASQSGGAYINSVNSGSTKSGTSDYLTYSLDVTNGGSFNVWFRGYGLDGSSDSFFYSVDAGSSAQIAQDSSWTWKKYGPVTLSTGTHTFYLRMREDGACIDKILLTKLTTTPSGLGGTSLVPGGGTPTPTPVTTPTPTPTPVTTPTPTPTPVTTPTPTPTGSITYPAQLLNLTNWKITLPIGSSGSPTEIKQPALNTYSINPWFTLTAAKDAVQFRANCGGTTTSGSSYPRSELREMADNGTTNASWSSTSGSHHMYIRQAITHLPVVKNHVVAGQIHDANDDLTVIRLEGTNLYITDGNTTHAYLITSSYQLGTIFTIDINVSGGQISYYYNGNLLPYTQSKSGSGWYYKAGCYTQSNTSTGDAADAYGEVYIYDVQVTHN